MNTAEMKLLYEYNYWANARVLQAATRVSPDQLTAPGPLSHGSLRDTLAHILGTEIVWRLRCQEGISPRALPTKNELPTLETIQARWTDEERLMRGYIASLNDEVLNATVQYTTTKGMPFGNVVWHVLLHVVNHGTQFRSEAGVALTGYGHSPGDLDLLLFLREGGAVRSARA